MANYIEIKNTSEILEVSFNYNDCEKCKVECGKVAVSNYTDKGYHEVTCYSKYMDLPIAVFYVKDGEMEVGNDVSEGTYLGNTAYFGKGYEHLEEYRRRKNRTEIKKRKKDNETSFLMVQSDWGIIDCSKIYFDDVRDEFCLYYYSLESGEFIGNSTVKKKDLYYDKIEIYECIDKQGRKYLSASIPEYPDELVL